MSLIDPLLAPQMPLASVINSIIYPPIHVALSLSEWSIALEALECAITLNISEYDIILEIGGNTVPSKGETFRVNATLIDLDDSPITGDTATHLIKTYNPSGTLIDTKTTPSEIGSGDWSQDFTLPNDGPKGVWVVSWAVTMGGTVGIERLPFWVSDP